MRAPVALQCVPQRRAAAVEQAQRLFARRSLRGAHTHSVVRKWSVLRYRATGRGFVVRHESFSELFRFYATSHFFKVGSPPATSAPGLGSLLLQAIEILSVLIVYYIVAGNIEYGSIGLLTWSMWFVAVCWIFTPFWFNPLAFDWSKTLCDFEDWTKWMKREVSAPHAKHHFSRLPSLVRAHCGGIRMRLCQSARWARSAA